MVWDRFDPGIVPSMRWNRHFRVQIVISLKFGCPKIGGDPMGRLGSQGGCHGGPRAGAMGIPGRAIESLFGLHC